VRRFAPILIIALTVLWLGAGIASALSGVHIRKIDTSAFPDVAVTVALDRPVESSSFSVEENGRAARVVTVRSLEEAKKSFDVVLAIDTSNSVKGAPLASGIAAARAFIQELPADVPVGIETFSDQARVVLPVTSDHAAGTAALADLTRTRRGTALYDGVEQAAAMFSGSAEHNVVLVTDGQDSGSSASLEAAVAAARRAHVTLYCIGVGPEANGRILAGMARSTHGVFASIDREGLTNLYRKLAGQLSSQYVVTYRSRSAAGAQITVEVSVEGAADRSIALIPRRPASLVGSEPSRPLLSGTVGLVVALALPFLAILLVVTIVLEAADRARRTRRLAARVTPVDSAETTLPSRPDKGSSSWLPESLIRVADSVVEGSGMKASLARLLERGGVAMTAGELVTSAAGIALVAGLGSLLLFKLWWLSLLLVVVAAVAPFAVVSRKRTKRIALLHEQLPDVLMILASSLRAGHSFLQALNTVVNEVGEPSAKEFSRVLAEIRLGRKPDEALTAMADRIGTEEFKWAVLGINVQHEVGGNLAEILDTLAETVRERHAIRRQVKALSAEGRLSMKIIAALPPLLALYIIKVNPSYMRLLWTTRTGVILIVIAVLLMGAGLFVARKIVRIDV
jgi:tight adherence protein B